MSTKRKKLLAVLLIVLAAAMLALAGCKVGPSTAQDIIDKNGLTARVIYYANEGEFNNATNIRSVYFKADTPVLNIAQNGYLPADTGTSKYPKNIYVDNSGYLLAGWEYVELDENENPVFLDSDGTDLYMHVFAEDEDIEIPTDEYKNPLTAFDNEKGELVFRSESAIKAKSTGTAVDFTQKIPDNAKWYFVASWVADVRLNYVLVSDAEVEIDGTTYKSGDTVYKASYGKGSSINVSSYAPQAADSTFLQGYEEEECLTPVNSVSKPNDGNDNVVYVKYIAGLWDVVKEPSDVSKMFTNLGLSDKQFYIFNDIDCSKIALSPNLASFKCKIAGNGHKLQNLTVTASTLGQDTVASMFGSVTKDAVIEDLILENVYVRLTTRNNVYVSLYMIFSGVEDGATISGLQITNADFVFGDARGNVDGVIVPQTVITNIPYSDGNYDTTNWMFGGLDTDEAFKNKYGIVLNGYSLSVVTNSITLATEELLRVEATDSE